MNNSPKTNTVLLVILIILVLGVIFFQVSGKMIFPQKQTSQKIQTENLNKDTNIDLDQNKNNFTELTIPIIDDQKTHQFSKNVITKILIPKDITQEKNMISKTIQINGDFLNEGNSGIYFVKKPNTINQLYFVSNAGDATYVLYDLNKKVFKSPEGVSSEYFPFKKITSNYKTYYEGNKSDGTHNSYYAIFDYSNEYFFVVEDKNQETFKKVNF